MKAVFVILAAAASVFATPVSNNNGANILEARFLPVCASDDIQNNPQCCAADLVGAVGIDCETPASFPHNGGEFKKICADLGKTPKCCALTLAEQGLLCAEPFGY